MTTAQLQNCLTRKKNEKYGFPYFKMLLDKGLFFDSSIRLDIERRQSDTLVFNEKNSIAEIFSIQDGCFDKCYSAVVEGEGGEKRKIHSLRSSSLLGLLSFYKVYSGRRIEFEKRINGKAVHFILDKVVFEKTNRVFHPSLGLSSIDIALYGTANGEPSALYLESKFTEYLDPKDMKEKKDKAGKTIYPISGKYLKYYKELFEGFAGLERTYSKEGVSLFSNDGKAHYCEGVKQMVSHYIGAKNSDDLFKGLKVYLGTILFDFSEYDCDVDRSGAEIQDYMGLYSELAKRLNSYREPGLTVIEEAFTYQDFFANIKDYELDKSVKDYYQL